MSRGQGRAYQRHSVWWIDYSVGGMRHREPTGAATKKDALDLLRVRIGDRQAGKVIGRPDRVVLAQYETGEDGTQRLVGGLRWLHETQYDLDGLRSKERMRQAWDHVEKFFPPPTRVTAVTPLRLDEYAKARLAEGAARQTVNNELAALRRGFNLAIEKGLLATAPKIKLAKVQNARVVFFEQGEIAAMLLELTAYIRPIIQFLNTTGWRVMEVLGLTWDRVDWERQGVWLSARQTKGKQPRLFPFGLAPDLKAVLEAAWEMREGPFVFQRNGKAISYTTLVRHWRGAAKRSGCTGRVRHDLRRTAVREFRRHGVDQDTIMALCGMKTPSIFARYNIVNEADLAEAVAKRFNGTVVAQSDPSVTVSPTLSSSRSK